MRTDDQRSDRDLVTSGYRRPIQGEDGIVVVGLIPFLLEPNILSDGL